jgi:hypothetical protein
MPEGSARGLDLKENSSEMDTDGVVRTFPVATVVKRHFIQVSTIGANHRLLDSDCPLPPSNGISTTAWEVFGSLIE